ncbi:hypothetical protein GO611_22930 [Azoarcus communis SWub3 = DSM 12120]|nr:hypothetical protein [Parazoarcus communis SWub3 = DSM 12120]
MSTLLAEHGLVVPNPFKPEAPKARVSVFVTDHLGTPLRLMDHNGKTRWAATAEKSNEIVCHERTRRQFGGCGVSPEMRVGPSKSAYRSRFQTATSCVGKEPSW